MYTMSEPWKFGDDPMATAVIVVRLILYIPEPPGVTQRFPLASMPPLVNTLCGRPAT
jgi:hypothetical protein